MFRPQHATVRRDATNGIAGKILDREFLGAAVRYKVSLGQSSVLVEAPFSSSSDLLAPGSTVGVDLTMSRVLLLAD